MTSHTKLREATVLVQDGEQATLVIRDDEGEAFYFTVPKDMAFPFRDTVRELVRIYHPDEPAPGDELDTVGEM